MKQGNFIHSNASRFILLIVLLSGQSSVSLAKSIYDPFVQKFQVGTFTDPQKLELEWGFPAGLMETANIDASWTNAGLNILGAKPTSQSPHLCLQLLAAMGDEKAASSWTQWHRLRIQQLVSWSDSLATGGRYLLAERLTMGFFRQMELGDLRAARHLAVRLTEEGKKLDLPDREIFIWDLRNRLLLKMLVEKSDTSHKFWNSMLGLGSYDMGSAWSLWTAHRRLNGYAALPKDLNSFKEASKLVVLRKSWLESKDIRNSAFSKELQIGLGAKLLKKQELNDHLALNPDPPSGFTLQGWWVSGQRASRRGQTDFYEELANRDDLKNGWKMDLWRRASEVHLLNNRWEPGLVDLEHSLNLAGSDSGSKGQRRRLRQWAEQALVLALAQNDTVRALKIYSMANDELIGEQKSVFQTETRHWLDEMGLPEETPHSQSDWKDQLRFEVEKGNSQVIRAMGEAREKEFAVATATPLWSLWARWGSSLIQDGGQQDLKAYLVLLDEIKKSESAETQKSLVVKAVALQLKHNLDKEAILRWVLDKDIHHLSEGQSLTAMSPMSRLAKKKIKDPAALHALLGIALLADDLRGIVGVATPMPQTGLTKREKLCFLYPLPGGGSIHQALSSSNSDPALLLAVARNESLFEPSVRSRAGALGWMQIMPFHFPHKGARPGADNWSCAAVSIAKGDALMVENRRRYDGNPYLALAAYNAGPGAVARWQKQLGGNTRNDIFLAWIGYPETRHYVEKVLIDREIYNWIISESRLIN